MVFRVMLADPYIISNVPRASPRIYCFYCGFSSVRVSQRRHDAIIENFIIIIQNVSQIQRKNISMTDISIWICYISEGNTRYVILQRIIIIFDVMLSPKH